MPQVFEITAPNGRKYEIEANDGVTQEQALQEFQSLPEQDWTQYELKTSSQVEAVQVRAPIKVTNNTETVGRMAGDSIGSYENYEVRTLSPEDEQTYVQMSQDPNVSFQDLSKWAIDKGMNLPAAAEEELSIYRQAIAEGRPVGTEIAYKPIGSDLLGEYTPDVDPTVDSDFGAALEKGMAYNPMGVATRLLQDFFDTEQGGINKDAIRERYPNLTDDEIEGIHDRLIGEMRRRELINANVQVDERDVNPLVDFAGDVIGGASPIDMIPFGRGATVGKRLAESAVENVVADAIVQGGDVSYGAQQKYDPIQGAVAAASGMALQGGGEALLAGGRRLIGEKPQTLAPRAEAGTIVAPTSRKYYRGDTPTKKYKQELDQSASQVVDVVNTITADWTNTPSTKVYSNFEEVEGVSNTALGVYQEDGTVLLNTEAILNRAKKNDTSPEAVVESVMFHEALGHAGLTELYQADLDAFLTNVLDNARPELRQKVDDWIAKRPSAYSDRDQNWQEIRALEEVMAEMSEKEGLLPRRVMDSLINIVKDFARRAGLNLKYSTREIRAYLAVAQRRVTEGTASGATPGSTKNMVVYHGSGADFDKFDHSKMGTGEGQQVFGWGTYLTDEERIAKSYKEKLSQQDVSFDGRRGPVWQLRDMALNKAYELGLNEDFVDSAFSVKSQYYPNKDITGQTVYDTRMATPDDPDWDELAPELRKEIDDAAEFVNARYEIKYSGKTYKVEIPDDAKWLEWETPLNQQPELIKALKDQGIPVLNREQHEGIRARIKQVLNELKDPELTAPKEKELDAEFDKLDRLLKDSIRDSSSGQNVYQRLVEIQGNQEAASNILKEAGFTGNRYLANNLRTNAPRKNDGTDKFNYVVFDDNTPKIVNKYMEGESIDPDSLTGEDLVNSKDAFELLNRIDKNFVPTTLAVGDLANEAVLRGMPPSAVARWAGRSPGELTKRLFLYDIAAQKLHERVLRLGEQQRTNPTAEGRLEYVKTLATLEDVTAKIFTEQSELGRALNAIKQATFTAKKVRGVRDVLAQYDMAALSDPETFNRLMDAVEGEIAAASKTDKKGNPIVSALNLPRAIMSSLDLSAPLRQGIVFIGHKEYWKSFASMFSMLGPSGAANYAGLMRTITRGPNFPLMQAARLSFSDIDGKLSAREEDFQSEWARYVPGVKMSEQAYAGFLNKLRADMFNKFIEQYRKAGLFDGTKKDAEGNLILSPEEQDLLKGLGSFINSASGRAELPGGLSSATPQLNTVFFSARLIQSRFNILNPYYYYRLPGPVRKEAIKSMMSFGVIAATVAGALDFFGGDEVEVEPDPRSSDFGKVKVGNTRFDIGGGFLQYLTLGARTASWLAGIEAVKTSTGELNELGPERNKRTYGETVLTFFRNKLAPVPSFFVDAAFEKNAVGEPFTLPSAIASRIFPMHMQTVYDAAQEYDPVTAVAVTAPGIFGVGVNTYTPKSIDPEQKLEAPEEMTVDGEKFELTKEEVELYTELKNNYFEGFVLEFTMKTGKSWDELSDEEKQDIIEDAKKEANLEARYDMMDELGL